MEITRINRLKIVLAEQNKTGKWLAEQLQKNEATVGAPTLLNHHWKCL